MGWKLENNEVSKTAIGASYRGRENKSMVFEKSYLKYDNEYESQKIAVYFQRMLHHFFASLISRGIF